MSKFNDFGKKLDQIAREAFKSYQLAQARLTRAEDLVKQYPRKSSPMPGAYEVQANNAAAELAEAKEEMRKAKEALEKGSSEISKLRQELVAAVDSAYAADPGQLDASTLTLLDAGILRPTEYARLLQQAQEANNQTMCRIIGKRALDLAEKETAAGNQYTDDVRQLRQVYHASRQNSGNEILERFDYLRENYDRAVTTPVLAGMTDRWDKLCGDVVEQF